GLEQARYWLYRIARNLLTDHYRRLAVRKRTQEQLRGEAAREAVRAASAEAAFEAGDRLRRIERAVASLPEEQRRVLLLHLVGEMNSRQIGELLEVPAGTVRYRLSMARKALRLRAMLAEEQEEVSR